MKASAFCRYAMFAGCIAAAACSNSTEGSRFQYVPSAGGVRDRGISPPSYRVLHSFGADHDGNAPNALISVGDTFYGTSVGGGANSCGSAYGGGCGAFFSVTADGTEHVLHSFGKDKDGYWPVGGLLDVGGTFYGATTYGGANNYGTIFSVTTSGNEKVVYSFGAKPDGELPMGDLIVIDGTLYGTTGGGGTGCGFEGCGTVFSLTTRGKETVLHRFDNATGVDGWYPYAGLAGVGGTLYGITYQGGTYGWGTVFSMTRSGKFKLLYSFGKGSDGWYPDANLIDVGGTLYGTTKGGGTGGCGHGRSYGGCGTVFSITKNGKERVLHSFDGANGGFPESSLINVGGTLYGTTRNGGANSCGHAYWGCGTVFSITTSGKEKVLKSFREGDDGWSPLVRLIYKNGRFFGTTFLGGAHSGGVVFSLQP